MADNFKFRLYTGLIVSFLAYTFFIYTEPGKEDHISGKSEALKGKIIWQEKNCVACHQLYGLGGFLGPDLSNIHSAPGKGAAYIKALVRGGTAVMPGFDLSEAELDNLIAFLAQVDASGNADPKSFKRNADGTIEQQ